MNFQTQTNKPPVLSGRDVTAILGPTNTGKTHLAIERMVAHQTGVIGLPLRLLAREVYGRVVAKVGEQNVALITGEEKITPPGARYSVCTVEAMPRETDAAFVAIDEVQLAADLERGHIFTDRILHLRGRQETLLLGAGTMRGILERLLPGLSVITRPRMSVLTYAGSRKITRLPRRSAIVAFSSDEVYAIGELIRRQRGGVAVVLGALSPRTRNAQVALYQSGDVDYLVATDAIGMGLNLDVDHVAFAQNRKFDGFQYRDLNPAELGQIAGRAGRHLRDGTFGVTGQVDPLSDELVQRIESHQFDAARVLQWRSAVFDLSSVEALKASLDVTPPVDGLTRALPAADARVLELLSKDEDIRALAGSRERVALLWDACALPDYRKIAPAQHAELVGAVFGDLARLGHVDEDYMADQVRRASSTEGDIDTLSHRIAQIRTWTFVSHRPGWLADPTHWQEKTREIEDSLSDALHERLTKRFVDRRTSVLMKRLRENAMPEAEVSPVGEVLVEGHHVGEMQGFRFTADRSAEGEDARAVKTAAQKALALEFEARAERFAASGNGDLALDSDGFLRWLGQPVATLVAGEEALKPRVVLLADEQLTGPARDKVVARAERFVNFQIEQLLKPLVDLRDSESLSGMARGIAFQLAENFGLLNRRNVSDDVRALDQDARAALRRLGVRFGAYHIFVPALIKPAPAGLVTLLWALKNDAKDKPGYGDVVTALAAGRTSIVSDVSFERAFYGLAGYRNLGRRAVRVDILERLADLIRPALGWKPGNGARPDGAYDGTAFVVTPAMMSILGATAEDMEAILKGLGYRGEAKQAEEVAAHLKALDEAATAKQDAAKAAPSTEVASAEVQAGEVQTVEVQAAQEQSGSDEQATAPAEQPQVEAVPVAPPSGADEISTQPAAAETVEQPPVAESAEAKVEADAPVAAQADAAEEQEEPKPVLIWRQSRFDGRKRQGQRPAGRGAGPGAGKGAHQGSGQERHGRPGRAEGEGAAAHRGKPRGKGRSEGRGDDADKHGFKRNGAPQRQREERPVKIDPNSPFAKLAALKEQMKK